MLKSTQPDTAPSTFVQKDWFSVKSQFLNNGLNNMKCLRRQKWDDLMEHRLSKENWEVPSQRKDFSPETLTSLLITFISRQYFINSEVGRINSKLIFQNGGTLENLPSVPLFLVEVSTRRSIFKCTTNFFKCTTLNKSCQNEVR